MAMYQNMLVVIDPNQDDQPALRRAVYLHQRIGGKIKAFLPIYDFSYEMTTLLSPDERTAMRQGVISQRTAWIREQAKYYLEAGVPIEIKVVWHNRPFEAIIQEVIAGSHDLVLKMAHQHDRLEAVIFTPTDWHLLRKCPSPVWMVKDQPWPEGGKALVAVNLASEEPYHNALNEKLVKETLQFWRSRLIIPKCTWSAPTPLRQSISPLSCRNLIPACITTPSEASIYWR